jgi:hypothetical protein
MSKADHPTDDIDGHPTEKPVADASETAPEQLTVSARNDGIVAIHGPPAAIERFVERVHAAIGSPRLAQATQMLSMMGASIDAVPGVGEGTPTLYQFSQRSMELLRNTGVIGADSGFFRGVIPDDGGVPDWFPITSGADIIQLQTAAVGLALQASIKNLTDAVERVENRLDELRDLVRSGQVGEVLGHHRVLTERLAMIDKPNSSGLGDTDWMAIAHLHPHIVSGLERTRFFIRSRMGLTEPGRMVRSRVDAAEKLIDANLPDALGLLATCEHNLAGWQRLRLDRVVRSEPVHLDAVLADMDSSLDLHRKEDQALVDDLVAMIDTLMEPTGLEGLEILQRRRLIRHVEAIHAATTTFAHQRGLAMPHLANDRLPTLKDSTGLVASKVLDGSKWTYGRARRVTRRARSDGKRRQPGPPDPLQRSPHE